jgi:hypothetical protein
MKFMLLLGVTPGVAWLKDPVAKLEGIKILQAYGRKLQFIA